MRKNKEAQNRISIENENVKNATIDVKNNSIGVLTNLLEAVIIDEENTIFPSEPKYKPVLTREEREKVKGKIFDIIKHL